MSGKIVICSCCHSHRNKTFFQSNSVMILLVMVPTAFSWLFLMVHAYRHLQPCYGAEFLRSGWNPYYTCRVPQSYVLYEAQNSVSILLGSWRRRREIAILRQWKMPKRVVSFCLCHKVTGWATWSLFKFLLTHLTSLFSKQETITLQWSFLDGAKGAQDFVYGFGVSMSTTTKFFRKWIDVIFDKLPRYEYFFIGQLRKLFKWVCTNSSKINTPEHIASLTLRRFYWAILCIPRNS